MTYFYLGFKVMKHTFFGQIIELLHNFTIQVTIWWAGLMRGAVSMALAYNQVSHWMLSFF